MNIDLSKVPAKLSSLLRRFHVVLFVVVVFGSLAVAVLVLSSILQTSTTPSDQLDTSTGLSSSFDQTTIDRVGKLRTGSESPANSSLPQGRINPFAE